MRLMNALTNKDIKTKPTNDSMITIILVIVIVGVISPYPNVVTVTQVN